jgi:gamma-glutamyltranspeptidase/glutathione hydrolase
MQPQGLLSHPSSLLSPLLPSLPSPSSVLRLVLKPGHVQVLLNMLTFGYSPQSALDAPRIAISPHDTTQPDAIVHLEHGISHAAIQGLLKLGHNIRVESGIGRTGYFGRGQIIRARRRTEEEGGEKEGWVLSAGSDMRGDGGALPFNG